MRDMLPILAKIAVLENDNEMLETTVAGQVKEIERLTERVKMYEGLAVGNAVRFETAEDKLELAVKALKDIRETIVEGSPVKTYQLMEKIADDALSSIQSLSEGSETP